MSVLWHALVPDRLVWLLLIGSMLTPKSRLYDRLYAWDEAICAWWQRRRAGGRP